MREPGMLLSNCPGLQSGVYAVLKNPGFSPISFSIFPEQIYTVQSPCAAACPDKPGWFANAIRAGQFVSWLDASASLLSRNRCGSWFLKKSCKFHVLLPAFDYRLNYQQIRA
jgi:hypothetical protein